MKNSLGLSLLSTVLSFGLIADHFVRAAVADDGIVIENVTVISPERRVPLEHATVVIRNGKIAEIGSGIAAGPHAKRIDGRGRFLIPGLIDSHVHVGSMGPLDDDAIDAHPELLQAYRQQLPRAYLAFGFTTLVDLNLSPENLSWFNASAIHPNFLDCGPAVHTLGGYSALKIPKDKAAAERANLVYEAAEAKNWPAYLDPREFTAERAVQRVVESGGVCVKAFVEPGFGGAFHWPVPSGETLGALRAEAKRRGLVFVVHANGVEGWRAAVKAHADVIAHGLWHWPGKFSGSTPPLEAREVIRAATAAGVSVQPTLQAVYGDESIFDRSMLADPRLAQALPPSVIAYLKSAEGQAPYRAMAEEYRTAIAKQFAPDNVDAAAVMAIGAARASATLRLMVAENTKLLLGTDTPSNEGIGNPPGLNGRLELQRWFAAGVPLRRILRAATLENAAVFRLSGDVGTVEVGKRANLLLLHANPLETIAAYDAIDVIFLNGNPIERNALTPAK